MRLQRDFLKVLSAMAALALLPFLVLQLFFTGMVILFRGVDGLWIEGMGIGLAALYVLAIILTGRFIKNPKLFFSHNKKLCVLYTVLAIIMYVVYWQAGRLGV